MIEKNVLIQMNPLEVPDLESFDSKEYRDFLWAECYDYVCHFMESEQKKFVPSCELDSVEEFGKMVIGLMNAEALQYAYQDHWDELFFENEYLRTSKIDKRGLTRDVYVHPEYFLIVKIYQK